MNKTKLAICMADLEYQERFVNCFMNHYNHQYELHVFTNLKQLKEAEKTKYAVMITGEYTTEDMTDFVERGEIILNLTEDAKENSHPEKIFYTKKYQEVYKTAELIERLVADQVPSQGNATKDGHRCIGVYSLTQEMCQAPFAALLGNVFGEKERVLLLDLQGYSGLQEMEEGMNSMGLEDLLSAVMTGNYNRGRLLESICHGANWDYVCVSQNNECLAEGEREWYQNLISLLVQEFGYEKVIINFGTIFHGQLEMMEACQSLYFLCEKISAMNWREKQFFQEIHKRGKETFLQRIRKIEIPQNVPREDSWQEQAEKWNWSHMGALVRNETKKEMSYGSVV